jgi:anti-anti-sigma regulatory factor
MQVSQTMEITVTLQQASEPVAVMHLQGNIDASNFVQIVDKAHEIYQNPARNLILDLSEVPNISSTGLAAIHKIALIYSGVPEEKTHPDLTHSSNARKRVKLLSPQPDVEKALETAGLKLFFKVFRDLESALKSF